MHNAIDDIFIGISKDLPFALSDLLPCIMIAQVTLYSVRRLTVDHANAGEIL